MFYSLDVKKKIKEEMRCWHVLKSNLKNYNGPLAFLLIEGRRTFKDLLSIFGRKYVFVEGEEITEEEFETWMFWAENDFMPRNDKIKSLLMDKTHFIEGDAIPDSYITFLDHCNSWHIHHLRWTEKEKKEYNWRSKIDWPKKFVKKY